MKGTEKVFVLGDSRTGTTTLHQFLIRAGYNSIHYYFKESMVNEGCKTGLDENGVIIDNWVLLKRFIENSDYNAFSDYPTRTYFSELMVEYPNAFFILSRRKDLGTWQRSMTVFMRKFGLNIDIEALSDVYLRINESIRKEAEVRNIKFCEINIDDEDKKNSRALCDFLEIEPFLDIGHENKTQTYDPHTLSRRLSFFSAGSDTVSIVDYVESSLAENKGMLSEYGWVFLANDSSNYLQYLYGEITWSDEELARVVDILEMRRETLGMQGIIYRKFIIPEKSVVYPEFMPRIFATLKIADTRPARMIEGESNQRYSYLADILIDAKSRGFLYFKGDSHTNWLGAYICYTRIISSLNKDLINSATKNPIPLVQLESNFAAYGGDISSQARKDHLKLARGAWRDLDLGEIFDHTIQYRLRDADRKAQHIPFMDCFRDSLGARPQLQFKNSNMSLPRAVIFRDSTCDFMVDLLAEHFSESLFIWHEGKVYDDIIAKFKPDVVLHIQAERFFSFYPKVQTFSQVQ